MESFIFTMKGGVFFLCFVFCVCFGLEIFVFKKPHIIFAQIWWTPSLLQTSRSIRQCLLNIKKLISPTVLSLRLVRSRGTCCCITPWMIICKSCWDWWIRLKEITIGKRQGSIQLFSKRIRQATCLYTSKSWWKDY